MAAERILVIDAHPDPTPTRFVHALAAAYLKGASKRETRLLKLSELEFPLLRSSDDWLHGAPPAAIARAQEDIAWAQHIVFFYPLWLGDVPALLKGFLEQVMRPGVAFAYPEAGKQGFAKTLMTGKSARVVVTMGMPAFFYRLWYLGHGIAGMRRNILNFVGMSPVRETLLGLVDAVGDARRGKWIASMNAMGKKAV